MDVAEAADALAAAAREVADAWDEDAGKTTDRLISALTALDAAEEDYTFIRLERQIQARLGR